MPVWLPIHLVASARSRRRALALGLMRPPRPGAEVKVNEDIVTFEERGIEQWRLRLSEVERARVVIVSDPAMDAHDSAIWMFVAGGVTRGVPSSARGWGKLLQLVKSRHLVEAEESI